MNFVKASLKHRQVTFTVLMLMFAFGVYSLITMPRRGRSRITVPGGLVVHITPEPMPSRFEDQVTRKLEEYLFQFERGCIRQRPIPVTSDGIVEIHIWLQDNVRKPDIFWNKLRHQLLVVKSVELPQGVIGPVVNSEFGDTESMIIGIEGDEADYVQMKDYLSKLEDRLRTIPAVFKTEKKQENRRNR